MTGRNFDVDLGFRVASVRFLIAMLLARMSVMHEKIWVKRYWVNTFSGKLG